MKLIRSRVCRIVFAAAFVLMARASHAAGSPSSLYAITGGAITEINPSTGAILNSFVPPAPPQAGGGSGLAFSGSTLYYASIDLSMIFRLNPATGGVLGQFSVPTGTTIDALGFGTSSFGATLYALNYQTNILYLFNPTTGAQFNNLLLPFDAIGGIDFNHVTGQLYVSDQVGDIRRLNPNTAALLGSFSTGAFQYGIGLVGGRLFTTNGASISERSSLIGALAGGPVPEPGSILLSFTGAIVLYLRRIRVCADGRC
jgi:hypothetical protein